MDLLKNEKHDIVLIAMIGNMVIHKYSKFSTFPFLSVNINSITTQFLQGTNKSNITFDSCGLKTLNVASIYNF